MIKANELRIGNWIITDDDKLVKVENIHLDGVNVEWGVDWAKHKHIDLNGIKLTPEILGKAGFGDFTSLIASEKGVTSEIIKFTINHESRTYIVRPIRDVFVLNLHISDLEEIEFASFKYLHQLQNLYFALTNEELTIEDLNVERSVATKA